MNNKAPIVIAVLAVLSASSAAAEWRLNEPCSGKEGVIGSCVNRMTTRSNEATGSGKEKCAPSAGPTTSKASPPESPRMAANGRSMR